MRRNLVQSSKFLALLVICGGMASADEQIGEQVNCYPDLPPPEAQVGPGASLGSAVTIYAINIANNSAYPPELFLEDGTLSDYPGYKASPWKTPMKVRTCIGVVGDDGTPYPVSQANLQGFTIQLPGKTKPKSFVVTLTDRRCGITYTSKPAPTSGADFRDLPPDWHI